MNRCVIILGALFVASTARAQAVDEPPPAQPDPPPDTTVPIVEPTAPAPVPAAPSAPSPSPAPTESAREPRASSPFAPWPAARLMLELELYTQGRLVRRAGDDLSELRLDRGELGARVDLGPQAAAELRLEAIRSAVEGGALGVDGNSTIVRVRIAQIVATHGIGSRDGRPLLQLDGAIGFVPDPWIRALEDGYTVKPLSRTGSERLLGWSPVDLSALMRAAFGPARLTVGVGNGEGQRFPERNSGKTTTAVLELVPISSPTLRLTAAVVARDGSIGAGAIRERRFGGGLTAVSPWARGGVEVIAAYGLGDRGAAEGLLASAWAEAQVIERVFVAARGASLGHADDGGRVSTFGGGVAVEPWRDASDRARGGVRLWLAVDRTTSSGGAMPLPGAEPGDATVFMLIASAVAPFAVD